MSLYQRVIHKCMHAHAHTQAKQNPISSPCPIQLSSKLSLYLPPPPPPIPPLLPPNPYGELWEISVLAPVLFNSIPLPPHFFIIFLRKVLAVAMGCPQNKQKRRGFPCTWNCRLFRRNPTDRQEPYWSTGTLLTNCKKDGLGAGGGGL